MLTELEKIEHLKQKYHNSKRLYTVYQRSGEQGRYTFTLIYGTDSKQKAVRFVHKKELDGLFVIAYCARPGDKSSRCVHVSGMQTSLQPSLPTHKPGSVQKTSVKPQLQPDTHKHTDKQPASTETNVKTTVQGGV